MKSEKATLILFSCMIYNACIKSLSSEFIRIKRWDNGHNPTSDLSNMFRGTAGVDYPDFKTVPNTNFRCEEQIYEGGLYADVEASCQVYHVCHDGRKDSFLCGKGTIFNQQILACDYWYSAECDSAPNYYHLNAQLGNSDSPNNLQNNYSQNGGNNQNFKNAGNNPGQSNPGGSAHYYNGQPQQCNCLKTSFKTPWSFPGRTMVGSDK